MRLKDELGLTNLRLSFGRHPSVSSLVSANGHATVTHQMSAMFGVNFGDGRIKGYPIEAIPSIGAKTYYTLCTRGNESYGENEFVANGDGTITDDATGLIIS